MHTVRDDSLRTSRQGVRIPPGAPTYEAPRIPGRHLVAAPWAVLGPFLAILAAVSTPPCHAQAPWVRIDPVMSEPDAEGRRTVELVLPDQPFHLAAGQAREVQYVAPLPGGYRITAVSVFQGTYREDVVETLVEVVVGQRYRLTQASLHKEGPHSYDGWHRTEVRYAIPNGGIQLGLYVMAHATGARRVGVHFGLRLELEPKQ